MKEQNTISQKWFLDDYSLLLSKITVKNNRLKNVQIFDGKKLPVIQNASFPVFKNVSFRRASSE